MYLSNIHIQNSTNSLPAAICRAVDYVKSHDIAGMPPGEYPIEGRKMFVRVFDLDTKTVEQTLPEAHDKYIDVQFWARGEERLGYAPRTGAEEVDHGDPSDDIVFLRRVENERFVRAGQGDFAVLYPWDIHRPGIQVRGAARLRKAVVKVATELL